jgi:hypothetical protein
VGSHLLELNSPNSFGIDSSLLSIEIAKRRGVQNVKLSTWQNYISEQKFDSILLLMNGLGSRFAEQVTELSTSSV